MKGRPGQVLVWLAAWLFLLSGTWAAPAASSIELTRETPQELREHLSILHDPAGNLGLEMIRASAAAGGFTRLEPGIRHLGYREGATWVRFVLRNANSTTEERWLDLDAVLFERADLDLISTNGNILHLQNGAAIPVADRPLAAGNLLFPIRIGPGETLECYLRLRGKPALMVDLTLWQPVAYAEARTRSTALKALGASTTVLVILYSVLAWRSRREAAMLALAASQIGLLIGTAILEGFAAEILPANDGVWQSRALWAAVFFSIACHGIFARAFLRLPRHAFRRAWLLAALVAIASTLGAFSLVWFVPRFLAIAAITLILALSLIVTGPALREGAAGRAYLVAWIGLWGFILVRLAAALGIFPDTPAFTDSPDLGFVFTALAMAYALHLDLRARQQEGEEAHHRLSLLRETEQFRLQAAVDSRTRQLHESMARAEAANQAKSAFLSVISHELRTPLHTILGYTQLLQRQLTGDARDRLAIIANNSEQLLRRINDVLDFSRGEAFAVEIQLEPVQLKALVQQLENSAHLMAKRRGNRFETRLEDDCPAAVEADEARLLQVLQNLIDNACKFTEGGIVRLIIGPDRTPGAVSPDGHWRRLRFTVEDSGCGIPEAEQEQIFEPFARSRVRQHQPGVGLGLAIVRQFVRAMGGEVRVDSRPGAGSRFEVLLPMQLAESEDSIAPFPEADGPINGATPPRRLLVADDIAENRKFLAEACRRLGFDVVSVQDGEEALAACEASDPPVAVALVDQFMPVKDGWDFLRAIRQSPKFATLPVILVSAAAPRRPEDFPDHLEFDQMLLKPLRLERLSAILRQFVGIDLRPLVSEANGSVTEQAMVFPPKEKMGEFRVMVGLGQIVALKRWADALGDNQPELSPFCRTVIHCCQTVDLPGLKRLAEIVET